MPVKNICYCDNPPGGSITCEPHQLAICGVIRGQVRRECADPPQGAPPVSLVNWTLNKLSEETRHLDQPITEGDIRLLRQGHGLFKGETDVQFILPESVLRALDAIHAVDDDISSSPLTA